MQPCCELSTNSSDVSVSPCLRALRNNGFSSAQGTGSYTCTMALTPSRRSELRAEAHELIKVRAATDDRDARGLWMEKICERLQANAVQQIGKVLVVYRENFDKPREKKARGTR